MSEKSGFEELMSQVDAIVTHPLTPWLALGVIALFWILSQVSDKIPEDPIERLKRTFGADKIPHFVVLIAALLWGALVLLLSIGLITLLYDIVWNTVQPVGREAKGDFRFLLTKTAALTAVLGAMIALPFTALRLKLTANVLFNEKLNDANNDLHARYQTSEKQENGYIDVWKDDIIRRNGAIDRLEALAVERPAMATRIARMLCVYLREMTRDYPATEMPEGLGRTEIIAWGHLLTVHRSDMETAAQVLGRLHDQTGVPAKALAIDLTGVNLQAMQLNGTNFEGAALSSAALDGASLNDAKLNEANLSWAKLNGAKLYGAKLNWAKLDWVELNDAKLNRAELKWADLNRADLNRASLIRAKLNGANLSSADLNWAKLNVATFKDAKLDGAKLNKVRFDEKSDLSDVQARGAALRSTNLQDVPNLDGLVTSAFGDASVILPDDIKPLVQDKWPDYELNDNDYQQEWELFKGNYVYIPPQHREK